MRCSNRYRISSPTNPLSNQGPCFHCSLVEFKRQIPQIPTSTCLPPDEVNSPGPNGSGEDVYWNLVGSTFLLWWFNLTAFHRENLGGSVFVAQHGLGNSQHQSGYMWWLSHPFFENLCQVGSSIQLKLGKTMGKTKPKLFKHITKGYDFTSSQPFAKCWALLSISGWSNPPKGSQDVGSEAW